MREVREETGLVIDGESLTRVGRGLLPTAFLDVYVAAVLGRPRLVLDPAEVDDAAWVSWAEVEAQRASGGMPAPWVGSFAPLWSELTLVVAEVAGRG